MTEVTVKEGSETAPCALFISEKTLLSASLIIKSEPNLQITPDDLVKYQYGNITESNARQSLATLRKIGILDDENCPTDLGRDWANPITRPEATQLIVDEIFPPDSIEAINTMTNKQFASWLMERKPSSGNIALKNTSLLRMLLRLCENQSKKPKQPETAPESYSDRQMYRPAEVRVSARAGRSVLREVFELARETGLTVVLE